MTAPMLPAILKSAKSDPLPVLAGPVECASFGPVRSVQDRDGSNRRTVAAYRVALDPGAVEYEGGSLGAPDFGVLYDAATMTELVRFHPSAFLGDGSFRPDVLVALALLVRWEA